jgi:hypothetical protein
LIALILNGLNNEIRCHYSPERAISHLFLALSKLQ